MTKTATKNRPFKKAAKPNANDIGKVRLELAVGDSDEAITQRGILRTILSNDIGVDDAAVKAGMEKRTLYRMLGMESLTTNNVGIFRKAFGISAAELLTLGTPEP